MYQELQQLTTSNQFYCWGQRSASGVEFLLIARCALRCLINTTMALSSYITVHLQGTNQMGRGLDSAAANAGTSTPWHRCRWCRMLWDIVIRIFDAKFNLEVEWNCSRRGALSVLCSTLYTSQSPSSASCSSSPAPTDVCNVMIQTEVIDIGSR